MNDLEKMELVLKINDMGQRLLDAHDKQAQQLNDLFEAVETYRVFLENQARVLNEIT